MGKGIIQADSFPEIVERYNSDGKSAAYEFIRTKYGIKHPGNVIKRIRNCGVYTYDADTDRFSDTVGNGNGIFMDLDELCGSTAIKPVENESSVIGRRPEVMEKLVRELVSDRLLTLSRYITLDSPTRTILIDRTSLSADGYHIVTH